MLKETHFAFPCHQSMAFQSQPLIYNQSPPFLSPNPLPLFPINTTLPQPILTHKARAKVLGFSQEVYSLHILSNLYTNTSSLKASSLPNILSSRLLYTNPRSPKQAHPPPLSGHPKGCPSSTKKPKSGRTSGEFFRRTFPTYFPIVSKSGNFLALSPSLNRPFIFIRALYFIYFIFLSSYYDS